jgi:hypothetical protein
MLPQTPVEDAITRAGIETLELERKAERNQMIAITAIVLAAAAAWAVLWVIPYNARLNEVMDCMGDNSSEESYARCAETIR